MLARVLALLLPSSATGEPCSGCSGQRSHLGITLTHVPCSLALCARRRDQAKFRRAEASAVVVGSAPLRELCGPGGAAQGQLRGLMLLEEDAGDLWHYEFLAALGTAPPVVHVASSAVFQKVR